MSSIKQSTLFLALGGLILSFLIWQSIICQVEIQNRTEHTLKEILLTVRFPDGHIESNKIDALGPNESRTIRIHPKGKSETSLFFISSGMHSHQSNTWTIIPDRGHRVIYRITRDKTLVTEDYPWPRRMYQNKVKSQQQSIAQ